MVICGDAGLSEFNPISLLLHLQELIDTVQSTAINQTVVSIDFILS
jgi:hypothetical protein